MSTYDFVESKEEHSFESNEEDTLKTIESKEVELEVLKDSATALVEEVKKEVVNETKVTRLGSLYRFFCIFSHTSK